jgi:hypothetical protein
MLFEIIETVEITVLKPRPATEHVHIERKAGRGTNLNMKNIFTTALRLVYLE